MIASRASWRIAWLAAALLAGLVLAFARGTVTHDTPDLVLPATERIDDGTRDAKPVITPEPRGILNDALVDPPARGL